MLKRTGFSSTLWMVGLLLCSSLSSANDSWKLLGVAQYEQLNRTLLIARLKVTDTSATADALLAGKIAFRLEVTIVARSVSARRWRNLWMEGVMINHQLDQLPPHTNDINTLMSSLSHRLKKSDRFEVVYQPERGSQVILNDVALGPFKEAQFAVLLLRGWIGDVPLSSSFKQSLMSNQSEDWNRQMDALTLSTERQQETATLLSGNVAQTGIKKIKPEPLKKEPRLVAVETAVTKPTVAKSNRQVVARPTAPLSTDPQGPMSSVEDAVSELATNTPKASPNNPQLVRELAAPTEPILTVSDSVAASQPAVEKAVNVDADSSANSPQAPSSEGVIRVLDEDLLRLRQEYYQTLVAKVEAKKAIPFRAFQRRWKGNVRVQVTIDRLGKVLDSVLLEVSRHELFNQQALTAVKDAEPLPEMPVEITGNEFTFSVPLSYTFID